MSKNITYRNRKGTQNDASLNSKLQSNSASSDKHGSRKCRNDGKTNLSYHTNINCAPIKQENQQVTNRVKSFNNETAKSISDSSEYDNTYTRPDVLSVDSDFASGNGTIDSPNSDTLVEDRANNTTKMFEYDITFADQTRRESIKLSAADYSYCTPPKHTADSLLKVSGKKKGEILEKKANQYGISIASAHSSVPVTSDYNQRKEVIHGPSQVNVGFKIPSNSQSSTQVVTSINSTTSDTNAGLQKCAVATNVHASQSGKEMDMRYTDITHMQLKRSLDQINGQNSSRTVNSHMPIPNYMNNVGAFCDTNVCFSHDANANSQMSSALPTYRSQSESSVHSCHIPQYGSVGLCSLASSSSKFDAILQVKDAMLEEKESVILKLRLQVASLQHQIQEGDAALRQVVKSQIVSSTQGYISSAEASTRNSVDIQLQQKIHELEQLLGKAEFKLSETSMQTHVEKKKLEDKVKRLEVSLKNQNQLHTDFKKKQKGASERLEKYKKRVESLERYLGDLPTIEESNKLKTEANMLSDERENLVIEISVLKNKLEDKIKIIKQKESEIEVLTQNETEHFSQIRDLQEKLRKSEKSKEELGATERDELEDMKYEITRLQKEKSDAAQMVSGCERRMKQLQEKHKEDLKKLQEKLDEAEEMKESTRRDLFMKQQTANKVHAAMMNLSSQNQQLLDQKLSLQDKVKTLEKLQSNTQEVTRGCSRLQRETHGAVQDLKSVTQVLIQTAKGSDPNISALLGVRNDSLCENDEVGGLLTAGGEGGSVETTLSVEQTNKQLLEVRQMRKEIDQLRTTISNQYAENIGDNCITQ